MNEDLNHGAWMTFTADHDPADALAKFQRRHGRLPEHVIIDQRWKHPTLKVGPEPEEVM
jgi:uncharacterized protein (DUF2249 family)